MRGEKKQSNRQSQRKTSFSIGQHTQLLLENLMMFKRKMADILIAHNPKSNSFAKKKKKVFE